MSKFKAIILDLDGVIVDSEPIHLKAELAVCKKFNIQAPLSEWNNLMGWRSKEIFSYLSKKYGQDKKYNIKAMVDYKTAQYLKMSRTKLKAIPGAIKFIRECGIKFDKTALATSSKKKIKNSVFKKFGLENFFDVAVTADDIKHGKPHPEIYLKTIKKLKISAKQCLVVEDADNGIISAKRAGCKTIGITTTFSRSRLKTSGADWVVSDFKDLSILINKII